LKILPLNRPAALCSHGADGGLRNPDAGAGYRAVDYDTLVLLLGMMLISATSAWQDSLIGRRIGSWRGRKPRKRYWFT